MFTKIKSLVSKLFHREKKVIVGLDPSNGSDHSVVQVVEIKKQRFEVTPLQQIAMDECESWSPGCNSAIKKYEEELKKNLSVPVEIINKDRIPFVGDIPVELGTTNDKVEQEEPVLSNSLVFQPVEVMDTTLEDDCVHPEIEAPQNNMMSPVYNAVAPELFETTDSDPLSIHNRIVHDSDEEILEENHDHSHDTLTAKELIISNEQEIPLASTSTPYIPTSDLSPNETKILEQLKKLIIEIPESEELKRTSKLGPDLLLDGLDIVDLVLDCETEFQIEIDDDLVNENTTIDQLVKIIDSICQTKPTSIEDIVVDHEIHDSLNIHSRIVHDFDEEIIDDEDCGEFKSSAREI